MKVIKISLLALTFGLMSFTAETLQHETIVKVVDGTSVKWKSEVIDLGQIPQGKPVTIEFEFTNTGKTPVVITNVKASCGCTATDYTKEPVASGKKATIKATYNAAAKGVFTKTVTVTTNAEEAPKVLSFKGTVI
ncbi:MULTISPECIES: DUF1573 domain-containing protein [unclassified Flavobacterium]|uniref:DUF1573 domain-containing protein n=1 Tax=unclassified Flavobacterium TaxID=196869 RepID=UPI00360BA21D